MATIRISLLVVCLLITGQGWGQDFAIRELRQENASPLTEVYGNMYQDSMGYIWAGGAKGVFRFDGANWKNFPVAPGILDKECIGLQLDDTKQVLWYINVSRQLCYLSIGNSDTIQLAVSELHGKAAKIIDFSVVEGGVEFIAVNDIIQKDCSVWFVGQDQAPKLLSRGRNITCSTGPFYPGENQPYYSVKGIQYRAYSKDKKFYLAKSSSKEAVVSDNDNDQFLFEHDNGIRAYWRNFALPNQSQGAYFFFRNHSEQNFFIRDDQFFTAPYTSLSDDFLVPHNINIDREQQYWISTDDGILGYDYNFRPLNEGIPLAKKYTVHNFLADKDGAYWLGTKRNGILHIPNPNARTYTRENSDLHSDEISLLTSTADGSTIIVTSDARIYLIQDEKITAQYQIPNFKNASCLVEDIQVFNNRIYLTIAGMGIYILKIVDQQIKYQYQKESSIYSGATSIALRAEGEMILTSIYGLYNGEDRTYVFNGKITAVLWDNTLERLWIGGVFGLNYINQFKCEVKKEEVLKVPMSIYVSDIKQDILGRIWVSTLRSGVYLLENGQVIQHWSTEEGMSSQNCRQLFLDSNNAAWVLTDEGVNYINAENDIVRTFGERQGILDNTITTLSVDHHALWLGTPKGLYRIPLSDLGDQKDTLPAPFITTFNINDKPVVLQEAGHLKHDENNIEINLSCLNYLDQQKLRYHYRLLGYDKAWQTLASGKASIAYPRLPPGEYTLEASVSRPEYISPSAVTQLSFTINKPIWQRFWFLIVCAALLSYASISVYDRIKTAEQERMIQQLSFENRIAKLRNQSMRLQMNPHFIYNAMNALYLAMLDQPRKLALDVISKYNQVFRFFFEKANAKNVSIQEEFDFLEAYIDMEKLRFADRITVDVQVEPSLRQSFDMIPPMLIQPIIENAFAHGLFHKQGHGHLIVKAFKVQSHLVVEVKDDGVGFEQAQKLSMNNHRDVSSSTLLHDRIALMNQTENNNISLERIDLTHATGKPAGTLVRIKIPVTNTSDESINSRGRIGWSKIIGKTP